MPATINQKVLVTPGTLFDFSLNPTSFKKEKQEIFFSSKQIQIFSLWVEKGKDRQNKFCFCLCSFGVNVIHSSHIDGNLSVCQTVKSEPSIFSSDAGHIQLSKADRA